MVLDANWLGYMLILLVSITIGAFRYKSILNSSSKKVFWLVVTVFLFEFLAQLTKKIMGSNMPIYHFSTPTYLILIIWIYKSELKLNFKFYALVIIIYLISAVNASYENNFINAFPSNLYIVSSFIIIALALYFFYQLLNSDQLINLNNYPFFWVSAALLFFHSINLFGFGAFNFAYFSKNDALLDFFSFVRKLSNYTLYLVIGISFVLQQQDTSSQSKTLL